MYYKNQMHESYLKGGRILKNTIRINVKSKDGTKKIKLNIYYKNLQNIKFYLENNPQLPTEDLDKRQRSI